MNFGKIFENFQLRVNELTLGHGKRKTTDLVFTETLSDINDIYRLIAVDLTFKSEFWD